MLVYVSSYPRSGNSLMQQIINTCFEKPWTEVDTVHKPLNRITGVPEYFTNWRYNQEVLDNQKSTGWKLWWSKFNQKVLKLYSLEDWIALYDLNIPPHTKNCRYLLPGCLKILTPENRQQLAQEPTCFFVKTHHLPYPEYFEGEYVLQIVRHPAQVFTSYYNFIKKYYQSPKNLTDVIHGNVPYGSWSEWHSAWEEISPQLKDKFLRLKFKDVVSNQLKACEEIKNLIGLDYKANKKIPSFEELKKKSPNYYRSGQKRELLKDYSENDVNLIQKLHGSVMGELNYRLD